MSSLVPLYFFRPALCLGGDRRSANVLVYLINFLALLKLTTCVFGFTLILVIIKKVTFGGITMIPTKSESDDAYRDCSDGHRVSPNIVFSTLKVPKKT